LQRREGREASESDATAAAAIALDVHAARPQEADVATDGAHADADLFGDLGHRDALARTQQGDQRIESIAPFEFSTT
jgi:hypothetical protein